MPELRKDILTREWVIIATERGKRPSDFGHKQEAAIVQTKDHSTCPFCPGNENLTPPEIVAYRPPETEPNTPGWSVRTVANKFPALQREGEVVREGIGIYDKLSGVGAHEVIIDTPEHGKSMGNFSEEQLRLTIQMYCDRYRELEKDERLKYILLFKNWGKVAGASIAHSHSQLIATPVAPHQVQGELEGAKKYFEYEERCPYCDILAFEAKAQERIVLETQYFLSHEPYASKYPFQTLILPKRHCPSFVEMTSEEINDLAKVLRDTLRKIESCLNDPPYNYTLHVSPLREKDDEFFHWHLEIIPRLTIAGGFELGTGIYINVTAPEQAAKFLRETPI